MKIAATISRYLLGLIFLTLGLNGFLQFLHMPPMTGLAAQFLGALFMSHMTSVVFALQLLGAILLLIDRYVPLALTILGPIVFVILLFHIFMAPSGLPLILVTTILWFLVFAAVRPAFNGIFQQTVRA